MKGKLLDACTCSYESSILENTDVLCVIENMEKEKILREHGKAIWYSKNEDCWYCHVPDKTKKTGRKKIKRKKQADIEKVLCDYYRREAEDHSKKNATLKELFEEFMEYKQLKVTTGTVKRMMTDWKRFYVTHPDFINRPFREITKIDVDRFFNLVLQEQELKDKAFHSMCGLLKQVFNYAVDCDYIEKSPYRVEVNKKRIIPTRKNENSKEVFLPSEQKKIVEEMERRFANNQNNTISLAVVLDFELGVRKGELLAIKESDIQDGMLHICGQVVEKFDKSDLNHIKSLGFQAVEYTKSEAGDRWIPLTEKAKDIIRRVKERNIENGEKYKDFLFVKNNYIMSPDSVDTQLYLGCKHIGMETKTLHKIRKTYASTLYKRGVSIPVISKMLGHADESTTMKFYIFNLDSEKETNRLVLDALEGREVTTSDQTVIEFPKEKKQKNLIKQRLSAN